MLQVKVDNMDWTELCKGCGECCGPVPLDRTLFEKNKHLTQKKFKLFPFIKGTIIPVTKELSCIFLDKDKRCVIYEERPEICRLQGTTTKLPCPRIHDKLIMAKNEIMIDEFIENIKEKDK